MADRKLTIIATKGTLDWAYPPFILASTAAALGMEVSIFFTFYGLNLLLKDTNKLGITPTAAPDMPMKMPWGPKWFKSIDFGPKVPTNVEHSFYGSNLHGHDEENHQQLWCSNNRRTA